MNPKDFQERFEAAVCAAYAKHQGSRREAAQDVGRDFKINPRSVFRIVARKQKTADPR